LSNANPVRPDQRCLLARGFGNDMADLLLACMRRCMDLSEHLPATPPGKGEVGLPARSRR